jgi:hypothetical protein
VHAKGYYERTKHVNIYYYYIKDCVKARHISLEYVCTYNMAADGLIKPLDCLSHQRFLDQIGLRKPTIGSPAYNTLN